MQNETIQYRDFKFNTKDYFDYAEKSGMVVIKRFKCVFILKKVLTPKNVSLTVKYGPQEMRTSKLID